MRMYRMRARELEQLTHDHSLAQDHIDRGLLSLDEARTAPIRNVLTRTVGNASEVTADLKSFEVAVDDVYLLCGPAYHAGPGGYAFSTLFNEGTVVVMPSWDAREWLRLVDDERVTTTFMTPAHFIRILEVPEDERAEIVLVTAAPPRASRHAEKRHAPQD